jgi:hypothetical protein
VEHQRHRAPEQQPRRPLVVAGMVGALAGAAVLAGLLAAGWWLFGRAEAPQSAGAGPSTPTAGASASGGKQTAEARNEIAIPTAAPAEGESTDPILLLGDSLAVGIAPYVDAGVGDRSLTVDAAEGRSTSTSAAGLSSYAATAPRVWVVSLGTNDNVEEFDQQARSVMEMAGPDRCVVWFDVWREAPDESINASLDQLAAENPDLHVIPWHDTSAAHPEWFSGTDVHPSTVGYAVRGQMAIDAVQRYCD